MRRIAFLNRKGGVGKTSICAGVGSLIAASGLRVLLVDLDPQANLTKRLIPNFDLNNTLLLDVLLGVSSMTPLDTRIPGMSLVPSGTPLRDVARQLPHNIDPFDLLIGPMAQLSDQWDVALIDGPPGEEVLQAAAIGAAPWVIAPARGDKDSIDALDDLAGLMVKQRQQRPAPWANLMGVIPFAWKRSATRRNAEVADKVRSMLQPFGENILFDSIIWEAAVPAEDMRDRNLLPSQIPPDWQGPHRALADSYERLTEEILERLEKDPI